ncbi:MAG: sel1 repeat family protein [Clostridia bacterium]|nr:sel1 repeat family protein [Clostridia bacterium]
MKHSDFLEANGAAEGEDSASRAAELYEKAMALVAELNFGEAWHPMHEAAELGHAQAMAEAGYMLVHALGVPCDMEEGLSYLRRSASMGCDYACYVLWEMHDDGFCGVDAAEAKKWCEAAAELGDKKAVARMKEGFDLRSVAEILEEHAKKGNTDALWHLSNEYMALGDEEKAYEYFEKALDACQTDALLAMAECYADASNNEFYNIEKAEEYYRKAADNGSGKAILALGKLALRDTDVPFWVQAADAAGVSEETAKQHSTQFA